MKSSQLTSTQLLAYGIPGLPLAALGLPLYIYLPTFYAEEIGLGLATVGLVMLIARSSDVISDPLIGWLSDHMPVKSRRKLMIIIGIPLLMVSISALFTPPAGVTLAWLLGWSIAVYLAWTVITVPYTALGAELSSEYDFRSSIAASRESFVLIGTLATAIMPMLLGIPGDETGLILTGLEQWLLVLLPITILALVVFVPEIEHARQSISFRHGITLLRQNKPFKQLLLTYLLNGLANAIPATLFLLFVTHVLQTPNAFGMLLGAYFISGILGLPLGLLISRRFNKHHAWCFSMLWASAVFVWTPLLGSGDLWPFLIICLLSGLSLGIDMVLPASMQADVVDLDRLNGGGQRTGIFFGLWGMTTKAALALAVGIAFPLLALSGFEITPSGDAVNSHMLALLYGLLPVPFKLIAAYKAWGFTLGRNQQEIIARRITEELQA